ncbi:MAG: DUF4926 domain-containing protein, partial [Planctomycetes bacterium]|nr:DUF4926 domain-containing protein [Planctomycetota bacterium]
MKFKLLETALLNKDLPDLGLKRGDVGAVVEIYAPDALEVEFVRGSGETQALVTLKKRDVRRIGKDDLLACDHSGVGGRVAQGAGRNLGAEGSPRLRVRPLGQVARREQLGSAFPQRLGVGRSIG